MKPAVLPLAFVFLCGVKLGGQSGGRDLALGFRSLAGVTLNRDSAATIGAKLGGTRSRRVRTEHGVYERWCYVTADRSPVLLELMSDASDMGTPGRALNVIRLRADAPPKDREGCASLQVSDALTTPAGLRLGLGSRQIQGLLGRPTRSAADSLIYDFAAKEYLRADSRDFDLWNTPEYRESCFDAGLPYANVRASVIVLLRSARAAEIRLERYDQSIC